MSQQITPDQMRILGSLTHDPGFLLLLDILQAKHDDLVAELAEIKGDDFVAMGKLKYFQAFREVFDTLKVAPQNFADQAQNEVGATPEEFTGPQSIWQRYQRDRFAGIDPVEY